MCAINRRAGRVSCSVSRSWERSLRARCKDAIMCCSQSIRQSAQLSGDENTMSPTPSPFWSTAVADILQQLQTTPRGLTSAQAQEAYDRLGANRLKPKHTTSDLALFLGQFKSPIILILIFA